ncbi:MAG TPA: hypothetical protein VIQ97_02215, partial [Prevotella sp.]
AKCLDQVLPQVQAFAPQERSVYYFAAAESHFFLKQYPQAIPLYETMLTLCHNNEKGEALYRLGMCYLFEQNWMNAHDHFSSALAYYAAYNHTPASKARMEQLRHMMDGCREKMVFVPDTVHHQNIYTVKTK